MVQPAKLIASPGEFLGRNLDYYIVEVAEDIVTVNANLQKLLNTVGTRAQAIILGTPSGTGPYTVKFAIEHTMAWMSNPTGGNHGLGGPLASFTDALAAALGAAGFTGVVVTRATEIS
jgi:hypothetical protein